MKVEKLACPSCGAPISGDFGPNEQFECDRCGSTLVLADFEADDIIICPECRTTNNEAVRYCTDCGHQLRVDCVLCYTSNRLDVTHCANCGVNLERARTKRDQALAAKRRYQQEREQAFREKEIRQQHEKLQRLIEALDEPENHELAIYQLNQMGGEAITALIETLLNDTDVDARYGSAIALGQICSHQKIEALVKARVAKALIKALADSEAVVRYWSADALGKFRGQIAVEPLAALLKDPHKGVREQAQRSLETIGGPRVEEILDKSKGFKHWFK